MQIPKIMLVEDERIVALHLRQQLTKLGYQVQSVVSSGVSALRQIEAARPDLVLMDIHIDVDMDGIATAARIPQDYHIPVIYLTAYSEEATLARARATRPYGYLIKPFSERELHATIQMTLERCIAERNLRTTEERLRQSQKMEAIGQLAGGVAHDFNNILTVIYCNVDGLEEAADGDPLMQDLIADINRAAERGATLTQQLLAYSRRQALAPRAVVIPDLLGHLAGLLRRTLGETIDIELNLPPDLWRIRIDPQQLETALINLVLNARDAMPTGGRLSIEAANVVLEEEHDNDDPNVIPGHYARLTVTDTGIGMPKDVAERVFEPFFTTKPPGFGTGLGLSMVYGFVKQSAGHVAIESEPGTGTSVQLFLRAAAATTSGEPGDDVAPLLRAKPGEVLLVVEDNEGVRKAVVRILRGLGFEILESEGGSNALALLASAPRIDLLLTDVVLPDGMSGICLAQQALERRPDLKIVYMSGYPTEARDKPGARTPDAPLLNKPFQKAHIARVLRQILDAA